MERAVDYDGAVELFLIELFEVLLEKNYFSFAHNAKNYVDNLTHYVEQYVGILPDRDAPPYFSFYGDDLKYITYKANKATSWYIFYQQWDNRFLIRHITNNHVAAQYMNNYDLPL